jgi:hypothetical protein
MTRAAGDDVQAAVFDLDVRSGSSTVLLVLVDFQAVLGPEQGRHGKSGRSSGVEPGSR